MTAIDLRAIANWHRTVPAQPLYPDGPAHARLAVILAVNVPLLIAAFYAENQFWPWRARMTLITPGWALILAQVVVLSFVVALATQARWLGVVLGLLAATLLGYAFFLTGAWLIDFRRALQTAHLISRAVQLGLVGTVALTLGVAVRLVLCRQLGLQSDAPNDASPHYGLRELMFLVAATAVALGVANLFAYDFEREVQIVLLADTLVRTLPAALPWLWLVVQPKITVRALIVVFLGTAALTGLKDSLDDALTRPEASETLCDARLRAAAFTGGAVFNGLLLRGLGFRWHRG